IEDAFYDTVLCLLAHRSAGPELTETDQQLLRHLDALIDAHSEEGWSCVPLDTAIADWRWLVGEGAVIFRGSPADAESFLRGVLEGRIELPPSPPSPPVPPPR